MKLKHKYLLNHETLLFEQVRHSFSGRMKKISTSFLISLMSGIIFMLLALIFFDTPDVIHLKDQNAGLVMKHRQVEKQLNYYFDRVQDIQRRDNNVYRPVFDEPPISSEMLTPGTGGVNKYENLLSLRSSQSVVNTYMKMDLLLWQLYLQSKSHDHLIELARDREKMLASLPAIQPVAQKYVIGFCPFGMRMQPLLHIYRLHAGVDLVAAEGTPIYAAGDGLVTAAKMGRGGIGYYVRIHHGYGYETVYGHVSRMLVRPGQRVKRGEVIALVGTTGISNVNHLHYEVHYRGNPIDPTLCYYNDLTPDEYDSMIANAAEKPFDW